MKNDGPLHGILQREGDCVRPLKVIGKSGEAGDQQRGRFVFGDNDGVRLDDNYLDPLTDTKDKGDLYVFKDIDERLKEKGLFEDAQTHAIKRVIAFQIKALLVGRKLRIELVPDEKIPASI